jgi:mRNA-degrading endonuclease HigB of HigAB toxin-antitoxin module
VRVGSAERLAIDSNEPLMPVLGVGASQDPLTASASYVHHLVYVIEVLTHAEYDKRKW